jgi:hypothetical protein
MVKVIELNENGEWVIPKGLAGDTEEPAEYRVRMAGNILTLLSVDEEPKRTKEEADAWVKSFRKWVKYMKPKTRHLPDEALRRESFYD